MFGISLGTIAVAGALILIVAAIIRKLRRNKTSCSCGGDCGSCGHCGK